MDKETIKEFMKASSYFYGMEAESEDLQEELAKDPQITGGPILLPKFEQDSELLKLIKNRRTKRAYEDRSISLEVLAKLLWGTQGVTSEVGKLKLRAVASAGNRHPFNTYVLANRIEELKQGLYFYDRDNETLGLVKPGWLGDELSAACLDQKMISACSAVFIWTAVTARTTSRYRTRGYRYIFIDAGHIGAQIQLLCGAMGLISCNVAAFLDDKVKQFIGIESEYEIPVYLTVVGYEKKP